MDLIEKTLTYRGETKTLLFRELTAGQQVKLSSGYKSTVRGGESEMTLDLALEGERGQSLVQMTLVTDDGKAAYSSLGKLQDEPASKVAALVAKAREAAAEFAKRATDAGESGG